MVQLIELLAVISSATFGVLLARRNRLDFVGVFSLALIVAFGGGTLRDLFLDRHPLFWIKHAHYPVIVFVLALVTSFVPKLPSSVNKILYLPDALGLGLFSIVGADYALESGTSWFVAALLGVVTGTFGGVIGDVICNQVPSLFRSAPLYATCSFVGCWLYILSGLTPIGAAIRLAVAVAAIVVLRLIAIRWNIQLPEFRER